MNLEIQASARVRFVDGISIQKAINVVASGTYGLINLLSYRLMIYIESLNQRQAVGVYHNYGFFFSFLPILLQLRKVGPK